MNPYDIPLYADPVVLAVAAVAALFVLALTVTLVAWFVVAFRPRPLDSKARYEFWLKYHLNFRQVVSEPRWIVEEEAYDRAGAQ